MAFLGNRQQTENHMPPFDTVWQIAAHCNLPLCLHAALGVTLIIRAYIDRDAHRGLEAREHAVHGLIYICIGLTK